MNSAVINVKVPLTVKQEARKVAGELGLSLSALVNGFLRQVIRTRTVTFSASQEKPNAYMRKALKESEEDIKAGRVVSFQTGEEALTYLDEMIAHERKKRKN